MNPEITDLVRKLRKQTNSKGKPMSFRKIEKVLKEEYDHLVSTELFRGFWKMFRSFGGRRGTGRGGSDVQING